MNGLRNTLNRVAAVTVFTVFTTFAIGFAPPASAAVLVSQPFIDGNPGFLSAGAGSGFENADSFTLSAGGASITATAIAWWGTDVSDASAFEVLLGNSLGSLGSPLAGGVTRSAAAVGQDAGDPLFGDPPRDLYRFEKTLASPLDLGAGSYFLSIGQPLDFWYWATGTLDASSGVPGSFYFDSVDWVNDGGQYNMSFAIIGERDALNVPEPNVLALLALAGLGALLAVRRRRPLSS